MAHANPTRPRTRRRRSVIAAALALTALAACASDPGGAKSADRDASTPAGAPAGVPAGSGNGTGVATADSNPAGGGSQTPIGVPSRALEVDTRQLIVKMTVGIEVADVAAAVDEVIALAEAHGGQLYNSNLDLRDDATAGGDLVFKLPPNEVDAFLTGLEPAIGRRTGLQGTTDDVTRQLTDLDAQILAATASVERVRAMLGEAKDLGEVILLESELTSRQTHLEQLLAVKADLGSQVALATITVHLAKAATAETVGPPQPASKRKTGVGDSFSKGWEAFAAVALALVVFVGYTAPFLLLGVVGVLAMWRISRRSTRSRSAPPPLPPAPAADPRTSSPDSEATARTR